MTLKGKVWMLRSQLNRRDGSGYPHAMTVHTNGSATVALCAIMKLEAPYIVEWVAYHRLLGFDIFIADNGGDDGTSDLLRSLAAIGLIRRLDFTWYARSRAQFPAYRALLRHVRRLGYEYAGFIDCDEFFARSLPIPIPSPANGSDHIVSLFEQSEASQVSFHWTCYGSKTASAVDDDAPVIERFCFHSTASEFWNVNIKSFVRVREMFDWRNLFYFGPMVFAAHFFPSADRRWLIDGTVEQRFSSSRQTSFATGRILHYQIKTWPEFQTKAARGPGQSGQVDKYSRTFFETHDYDQEMTEVAEEVRTAVRTEISRIASLLSTRSVGFSQSPHPAIVRLLAIGRSNIGGHDRPLFAVLQTIKGGLTRMLSKQPWRRP